MSQLSKWCALPGLTWTMARKSSSSPNLPVGCAILTLLLYGSGMILVGRAVTRTLLDALKFGPTLCFSGGLNTTMVTMNPLHHFQQ